MNRSEAAQLARTLMNEHGLGQWTFQWSKSVLAFGMCNSRLKRIQLSEHLVSINDEARVRRTILHEIAHAHAGAKAGHGRKWQLAAVALGIPPDRCYTVQDTVQPIASYHCWCPKCETVIHRFYRKPTATGKRRHRGCGTVIVIRHGHGPDPHRPEADVAETIWTDLVPEPSTGPTPGQKAAATRKRRARARAQTGSIWRS